jgi:hypothetical protein
MTPNISRVAFESFSKFIYLENLLPPRQHHRPVGQRACFHGFLPEPFSHIIVTRQFLPLPWIWQKTIPALDPLLRRGRLQATAHTAKRWEQYWKNLRMIHI